MAITDWPEGERPRERLLHQGAAALSDAELLAIYLRVGIKGKSAVDLARDLLARFEGDLGRLAAADIATLAKVPGIGVAKGAQLKASFELARRALSQSLVRETCLGSPQQVRDWLRLSLSGLEREVFWALWLDSQNRLIVSEALFSGSLDQAQIYPREVVKAALRHNAAAVILAHNHPSGLAEPSSSDIAVTIRLKAALGLVEVRLLDHFVVGRQGQPVSFAERGLI